MYFEVTNNNSIVGYRKIIYNSVYCMCCGTTIQSLHTHDYKKCDCSNEAMVDGGLDYARYGAKDRNLIKVNTVYLDDDFETVRKHMFRGGHGKDMKGVFRVTRLFEMTDEHLKALIDYGVAAWQEKLVKEEINYRYKNGLSQFNPNIKNK